MIVPTLDPEGIRTLAEKYAFLLHARQCRDSGGAVSKAELAAIAGRFPGALRELDRNSAEVLRDRLNVTLDAGRANAVPDWLQWVWTYHHELAHALRTRKALGPGGRISRYVLNKVAEHHGVPMELVANTLFPRRR